MKVKPAPGRAVRDPSNMQLLPEDGREVPNNQFWQRRLRDGDVVEVAEARATRSRREE
jgi:hypothetical protein